MKSCIPPVSSLARFLGGTPGSLSPAILQRVRGRPAPHELHLRVARTRLASARRCPLSRPRRGWVAPAAAGTPGCGPRARGPSGCRGRCVCPRARPRAQLLFKGPAEHVARTQLAAAGLGLRGWAAPLRLRRRLRAAPARQAAERSCERGTGSHGRGGARPGKRGPADAQSGRAGPPSSASAVAFGLSDRAAQRPGRVVGGPAAGDRPAFQRHLRGQALHLNRFPIHCITGGQRPGGGRRGQGLQPRWVLRFREGTGPGSHAVEARPGLWNYTPFKVPSILLSPKAEVLTAVYKREWRWVVYF